MSRSADLSWFSWEGRNGPIVIIIIIFRSVSPGPCVIYQLLLSLVSFQQGLSVISLGHLHGNISLTGAWRFLGSRRSFIKIVTRQNTAAYSSMSFSHKTTGGKGPVWSRNYSNVKTPVYMGSCRSVWTGINQSGKAHFSFRGTCSTRGFGSGSRNDWLSPSVPLRAIETDSSIFSQGICIVYLNMWFHNLF